MNIVIIGLGEVGRHLLSVLDKEGHDIVADILLCLFHKTVSLTQLNRTRHRRLKRTLLLVSNYCRTAQHMSPTTKNNNKTYSSVSITASKLLQAYNVSMISYASTGIQLSDKEQHPLFARTVPSDTGQVLYVHYCTTDSTSS